MKNIKFPVKAALLFIAGILAVSCCDRQKSVGYDELKANFQTPPADVRTGTYWYWMNDNISVEGVQKDLEAMKMAGITKAFIGNIGGETQFPVGKVRIFTDEWWEVVHATLKKAAELDIEIGMFNCPGWSQSGGPWIKPNQTMRYLAFADTLVAGGQTFSGILQSCDSIFEDVKVLAFPAPAQQVSLTKTVPAPGWSKEEVEFTFAQPEKIRTLEIVPQTHFLASCRLQVKNGNEYQTVKEFEIDRSNGTLNTGWDKLAKVVVTFPAIEAQEFRLLFENIGWHDAGFSATLTGNNTVGRYSEKSLAKMTSKNLPEWDVYLWDEESDDTTLSIPTDKVIDI
ncbi:MAG: glycoside hydrolase family 2, partial [Prevotellaceae bacterium]|nr:glycoside hydrolase family 2 [Prevotellaceae bacterium]